MYEADFLANSPSFEILCIFFGLAKWSRDTCAAELAAESPSHAKGIRASL